MFGQGDLRSLRWLCKSLGLNGEWGLGSQGFFGGRSVCFLYGGDRRGRGGGKLVGEWVVLFQPQIYADVLGICGTALMAVLGGPSDDGSRGWSFGLGE